MHPLKGERLLVLPHFQTARATAAIFLKLKMSLNTRPIKMISSSYNLQEWKNFFERYKSDL